MKAAAKHGFQLMQDAEGIKPFGTATVQGQNAAMTGGDMPRGEVRKTRVNPTEHAGPGENIQPANWLDFMSGGVVPTWVQTRYRNR